MKILKNHKHSTKKDHLERYIDEGEKVRGLFHHIHQKSAAIQKEFVEFINRGSVIDLAIGVAVGGAFNTIVNSFVNDIVTPIVGLLAGGVNFNNLAIHIPNFFGANDEATIAYGKFLQSVLQFLIVAWVFFIMVKAMNGFHRKRDAEIAKLEGVIKKEKDQINHKMHPNSTPKKSEKSEKTEKTEKSDTTKKSATTAKSHQPAKPDKTTNSAESNK